MAGTKTADVDQVRPYQKMMEALQLRAKADGGSSFDIAANVIDQIATAETMDDIFAANETGPADIAAYLNRNLNIVDITVFKSAEQYTDGGFGTYVVMRGYVDDGAEFLLSTGAPNVVSSLFRAQQQGMLSESVPCRCQIVTKTTPNGVLYKLGRPQ